MTKTQTTEVLHTFQIRTWADSRSNRRDRTYTVIAEIADEALSEATWLALSDVRHNVTILCDIIDVDGRGAPQDCEHADARLLKGWVRRADGGRDCRGDCARAAG